jgi:hypothetical protein
MITRLLLVTVLVGVATTTANADTPPSAGRIKVVRGTVEIVRGDSTLPAAVGTFVLESDRIRTGSDGRVGLTLRDDTRLSLGPDSELALNRFQYSPADGRLALAVRFLKGVAGYISGRIAKLAPDAVRLETPAAIVGVRGTSLAIRAGA